MKARAVQHPQKLFPVHMFLDLEPILPAPVLDVSQGENLVVLQVTVIEIMLLMTSHVRSGQICIRLKSGLTRLALHSSTK